MFSPKTYELTHSAYQAMFDDFVATIKSQEYDFTQDDAELFIKLGLFITTIPGLTDTGRSTILEVVRGMADILCVQIDDEDVYGF